MPNKDVINACRNETENRDQINCEGSGILDRSGNDSGIKCVPHGQCVPRYGLETFPLSCFFCIHCDGARVDELTFWFFFCVWPSVLYSLRQGINIVSCSFDSQDCN